MRKFKNRLIIALAVVFTISCMCLLLVPSGGSGVVAVDTGTGISMLRRSGISSVMVNDYSHLVTMTFTKERSIKGESASGASFTYTTGQQDMMAGILEKGSYKNGYTVSRDAGGIMSTLLTTIIPMLLWVGVFYWMMRASSGMLGGRKDDKALSTRETTKFTDVRGEDTAVTELAEVRDMMVDSHAYINAGARMPKGILLYGPPGTGKTLLAKALAGETNARFFATNGSSFIEMFAGLGARRVRSLFEQARSSAPSIIFIDEIDAIGGTRNEAGGNSEREQTLNQLLVEMDGFTGNGDVLVVAATNRLDMLDKALLRPGRFDRQIEVDIPDMHGREEILKAHAGNMRFDDDVDFHWMARQTPGFSGAQLASVMNEAAVMAVRRGSDTIGFDDVSEGIDRVMAGPQKTKREDYKSVMRHTAYHEGGHAIVAMAVNIAAGRDDDAVTKVTILPRGRALGYTMVNSDDDVTNYTRDEIDDQLAYMMGGRAAEEVFFTSPSTGAANDIEKAAGLARDAVVRYGFSDSMGLGSWSGDDVSDATRNSIDKEISRKLSIAHARAVDVINDNKDAMERLVDMLMDKETVGLDDLKVIEDMIRSHYPQAGDDIPR